MDINIYFLGKYTFKKLWIFFWKKEKTTYINLQKSGKVNMDITFIFFGKNKFKKKLEIFLENKFNLLKINKLKKL